jgi:integrase
VLWLLIASHLYSPDFRAKSVPNLTDIVVQKLPEGLHFDTKVKSFGMRVGKSRKTWMVVKGENRTKITLGHYPDISLSEARKLALDAIRAPTWSKPRIAFPDALRTFLALPKWRPGTVTVMRSTLKPFTWKKQLHAITHEDVVRVLEEIEKPSARFHARKDITTFFNWTIPRYLDVSPCVGIKAEPQRSRDRVLTDDELITIWNYDAPPYSDILKLCLLTGQRVGEVRQFVHGWLAGDTITVPAEVAKNKRDSTFPFNLLTAKYLNRYLGRNSNVSSFSRAKKKIDAQYPLSHWTVHDLRRTFATIHARIGTPVHVVEAMLNHRSGTVSGVAAIYNRYTYLPEMRLAALNYETFIANLVTAQS